MLGPKTYLWGAVGLMLLSMMGTLAYYKHRAGVEHDNAIMSEAAYQNTAAALKSMASSVAERNVVIGKLGASYEHERKQADELKNNLARHQVAKDLLNHPELTLRAINGGTNSLFGAISCASDSGCGDPATQHPPAGTDTR